MSHFGLEKAMLLPFRLFPNQSSYQLPLALYSCGLHDQNYQYRPMGYPTLQCFINFGGYGTFHFQNNKELVLAPYHALLLPAKVGHEYFSSSDQPWLLGFIGIHGTTAEDIIKGCNIPLMRSIPLDHSSVTKLENKLTTIWQASALDSANIEGQLSVQLYEFLILFSEQIVRNKNPLLPNQSNISQDALQLAIQYMKQHYDETLLIANIAHAVGYSVQHFQRIFREAYGINPHAYLQRIRLQQAATWLENNPDDSIQEISNRLGLETSYFIRIFKKQFGLTPGKFRATYIHNIPDPISFT